MHWIFLPVGLGILLLESVLVYLAVRSQRRARWLARVPWSEIGGLQPGPIKVRGRVVADGELLRGPLSRRDCVYYHFRVQEKRQRGGPPPHGGGTYWKTVIDDAQYVPFSLDDGTGCVALRLKLAELDVHPDVDERSGMFNSARPELERMLQKRYGYSSVGLIFNRTLYSSETRIEEGDALVVLGTAREAADGGWELVRGDGFLIVSDRGPKQLLSSYRWTAFLWWFLAGVVLVAVGVVVAICLHLQGII
jgi:hypothetical protein